MDRSGAPPHSAGAKLSRSSPITNRTDLIEALSEAAQLEHGLCCAYLFAALSLKRRPDEGVPAPCLASLRNWESVLLLIARQEMEHLGIVCNLLTAAGGMPFLENPAFPIPAGLYGDLPELPLERFTRETLERFLNFEEPQMIHLARVIAREGLGSGYTPEKLSIACQRICAEMQWAAGDLWIRHESSFVPLLKVTGLNISYGPEVGQAMWAGRQEPRPPKGLPLQTKQALGSGIVNTYVEIPVYYRDELTCIWRFFYETFRSFDEEDELAHAIEAMLAILTLAIMPDPTIDPAGPPIEIHTGLGTPQLDYSTIGGFYQTIRKGFLRLCYRDHRDTGRKLHSGFQSGNPEIGVPDRNFHNMDIPTVTDLNSALAAIYEIIDTGEACLTSDANSHYVRLCGLQSDFDSVMEKFPGFDPARAVAMNPITRLPPGSASAPGSNLLKHPDAIGVAEVFDAMYEITLQMLARFFTFPNDKVLEGVAFGPLMTMAIRPLAEILTELTAAECPDQKAGPPFQGVNRNLLHPHQLAAWTSFSERLEQIAQTCVKVRQGLSPEHASLGGRLEFISKNIQFVATRLETAVTNVKAGKPVPATEE